MTESQRVLVVDDEPGLVSLYEAWLATEYTDRTATDGETALTAAGDADAVLLDRQMPGRSGDEVLSRLREAGDDCPVALVTAAEPDAESFDLPFDDYLVKPIRREEVVDCVERLLSIAGSAPDVRERARAAAKRSVLERELSDGSSMGGSTYAELERSLGRIAEPDGTATEPLRTDGCAPVRSGDVDTEPE